MPESVTSNHREEDSPTIFYDALEHFSSVGSFDNDDDVDASNGTLRVSPRLAGQGVTGIGNSSENEQQVPAGVPLLLQKRPAQWFEEGEKQEDNNKEEGILSVPPPSPPPGHSPKSAFHKLSPISKASGGSARISGSGSGSGDQQQRQPGGSPWAEYLKLVEHRRTAAGAAAAEIPIQQVRPVEEDYPASWNPEDDDYYEDEYDDDDINKDEDIEQQQHYGFCAIVPSTSNVFSDLSMTNSPLPSKSWEADVNALENAPSMETGGGGSSYAISPVSQMHDYGGGGGAGRGGHGGSSRRRFRPSPSSRWLPSPLSTGTGGSTSRRTAGSIGSRWTPRALFQRSPSSQHYDDEKDGKKVRELVRSTTTTSSTDDSDEDVQRREHSSYQVDFNDNPFIINDKDGSNKKEDKLFAQDDGNVECQLFANRTDLLNMQEAICGSYQQCPVLTTSNSANAPSSSLSYIAKKNPETPEKKNPRVLMSPKKLLKEFSPRLTKRTVSPKKKHVPSPLAVLPTNAVSVNSGTDAGKFSATFDPLLLIGSITMAHTGPIWRMEFSSDGKYLATAGEDGLLSIYEVNPKKNTYSCPTAAALADWEAAQGAPPPTDPHGTGPPLGCEIDIISSKPLRRYREHTADIVDLSWSQTNFLLTASLDKTVRLWHVSRKACLHVFRHTDFVSSVSFHPSEDRYFVSGSFDRKLRVWDCTTARVTEWAQTPDVITSVRYLPSENYIVAGLFHGQVLFYTSHLTYYTQISAKNKHGSRKQGNKVTGFAFMKTMNEDLNNDGAIATFLNDSAETSGTSPAIKGNKKRFKIDVSARASKVIQQTKNQAKNVSPKIIRRALTSVLRRGERDALLYKEQLLVTTNDSRLRLFGLDDYCLMRKYKGAKNTSLQIKARISESGEFVISGSDTGGLVHIWKTSAKSRPVSIDATGIHSHDKCRTSESFKATHANPAIVTDTHFVPSHVLKKALTASGLFPTLSNLDRLEHDLSSSAIITCDFEGSVRVLLRKQLLDDAIQAAGPEGDHFS